MDKYLLCSGQLHLKSIGEKFNIALIPATTMHDIIHKVKKDTIVGIILDDPLPSSLELNAVLTQLHHNSSTPLKIAVCSQQFRDPTFYQKLTEEMKITWVLPAPLDETTTQALCHSLFSHVDEAKEGEYRPSPALLDRFNKSIFEKLQRISGLVDCIHQNPKIPNLNELKNEVHKIAGSAAPYGYQTAGTLCRQLEHYLHHYVEENSLPGTDTLFAVLDRFYTNLILAFQHIQTKEMDRMDRMD